MSITNWTRLEPDTQTNVLDVDLDEGVAAKLADPLWLLGRQWQMGELSGEDAGSPVEGLVEHDGAEPDERTRIVGGISLVERLTEARLQTYATTAAAHFPL